MDEEKIEPPKSEQQVLPLICDALKTSSSGEGLTMMQLFRHAKRCVDWEPQSLKELLVDALKQGLSNGQLRQVGRGRVALATDIGGRGDIVGLCGTCGGRMKRKRSCGRKKKRSCRRKKKRSCRRKKKNPCRRKKRRSCRRKKRSCKPKKRQCRKKRKCPIRRCPGMLGEDSRLKGPQTAGQQAGEQGEAQQGNQPNQQPQRQRSGFIYRF